MKEIKAYLRANMANHVIEALFEVELMEWQYPKLPLEFEASVNRFPKLMN